MFIIKIPQFNYNSKFIEILIFLTCFSFDKKLLLHIGAILKQNFREGNMPVIYLKSKHSLRFYRPITSVPTNFYNWHYYSYYLLLVSILLLVNIPYYYISSFIGIHYHSLFYIQKRIYILYYKKSIIYYIYLKIIIKR